MRTVPVPSTCIKTYPRRGPLQQFRFADSTVLPCFRCGASKKSKLITIYEGNWSKKLCNGCYGYLLSIYKIKAGTGIGHDKKSEQLAELLLSLVMEEDRQQAQQSLSSSVAYMRFLSLEALRFLTTAEYLSNFLKPSSNLEWSPIIIGLCKATELELVNQLIRPLAHRVSDVDLRVDSQDPDIGRIAKFCSKQNSYPPELGAIAHFLKTVTYSKKRRNTSILISSFLRMVSDWNDSHWILDPNGLQNEIFTLTREFRNKAAHIDKLDELDYQRCRDMVIGSTGILWKLICSVDPG